MKIKKISHYDDFEDIIVFWLLVEGVDNKYKELAKEIDKENYLDDCFGICVHYDREENTIQTATEYDKELYYIDDSGNKTWFECEINKQLLAEATNICMNKIAEI